ncbi:MAG: L,D-transpeptidase family protein [Pseudomonadota bacterium]|nr:L,D-transpeptidase family protein [Pseudomonadota bacterium]
MRWINSSKKLIFLSFIIFILSICYADTDILLGGKSNNKIGKIESSQLRDKETLSSLARRNDLGYDELIQANPSVDLENIHVGDVLVIPSSHLLLEQPKKDIVVNLPERRLYHHLKGKLKIKTYPVGVGELGWSTPLGKMTIIGKRRDPHWYVPKSVLEKNEKEGITLPRVVAPGPDNPLGTRAMRLSSPSYLIHGTNEPDGVGKRSTAGCISLYPEDIINLYRDTKMDSSVNIVNHDLKWMLDGDYLCVEVHPPIDLSSKNEILQDNRERLDYIQQEKFNLLEAKFSIDKAYNSYWQLIKKEQLGVPQCVKVY